MREILTNPPSLVPPARPPCRARSCPPTARPPDQTAVAPTQHRARIRRLSTAFPRKPPPKPRATVPRFRIRGPNIERGRSARRQGTRPRAAQCLTSQSPAECSSSKEARCSSATSASCSASRAKDGRMHPSGRRQPARRQRRRVTTRQGRSASAGSAERVDTVTAVAFSTLSPCPGSASKNASALDDGHGLSMNRNQRGIMCRAPRAGPAPHRSLKSARLCEPLESNRTSGRAGTPQPNRASMPPTAMRQLQCLPRLSMPRARRSRPPDRAASQCQRDSQS